MPSTLPFALHPWRALSGLVPYGLPGDASGRTTRCENCLYRQPKRARHVKEGALVRKVFFPHPG
ncbi:putative palmitoyltransferase ZDHHC12 [Anopheles sinensis]|uniref:Putative palmitoyltransferase ZDHHC12 n=1 Tax=Anopheles sinensis TaxID=74873 RepID=A0A084VTU8_ANOSI|nr:putative palmitoyltransferase ZDHHC12 [Anopheles sinensis]